MPYVLYGIILIALIILVRIPYDHNGAPCAVRDTDDKNAAIGNEPYYPVLTEKSQKKFETYQQYASKFENLILCGRLADFKYYNMDQVILRALELYNTMEDYV